MKAKDSVKNYDSKIREYVNYSYRQAKNACKNFPSRSAGSDSEKELQKHLVKELESCADSVKTEEFGFSKTNAFSENIFTLVFLAVAIILTVMDCIGIFGENNIPVIIAAASVLLGVANIFTGFLNKLIAKKAESSNVFAVRKADGEAKKRVLLLAHSDSAPKRKFKALPFTIVTIAGFLFTIIVAFLNASKGVFVNLGTAKYATLALLIFVPFAIIPLIADSKDFSAGASKNLSGSFASVAVLKYFKDNNIQLPSTEICALITGAHEYDSAGIKNYMKNHSSDFSDIPTVGICLDSIACEEENLGIIKFKNSEKAIDFILSGASDAETEIGNSALQGKYFSDASVLSDNSIDAVTITSLGENHEKAEDTPEDMKVKTIETALKTVVSAVFLYDEK